MEVIQAIKERRSIRKYKPEPVSDEELNIVLEAARWAPSWANTQCWRFIVVRDKEKKVGLSQTLTPQNPSTNAVIDAPLVIVACAEKGRSGYYKGNPATDKGDWFMFDLGLAMQNLCLAAHSIGLGTVHIGAFNAQKAGEILNLPEGTVVVEMTPLGHPLGEVKTPPRKELEELVFYESYGESHKK